jgi:U3 small nucleolar RNA-associated protein 14
VKHNRETDQLDFTTRDVIGEGVRLNSINQIASNLRDTHATSKLERQIQEELSRQGLRSEKDVKQIELESLSASVKPEQLEQRYGQIAQMKHLLFRQEMKNRRVSKIKSKLYHKLKKREKDREEKKLIDYLEQIDPEAAQAYRLKEEHKKVEERLKLRHSSNNKFSKTLKRFGGMENESLKEAFNDMMKEKNALKSRVSSVQSANKRALDSEEDDDDGGSEGSDIEDEITLKQ